MPQEYHNSKRNGRFSVGSNNVFIYNVSKRLVKHFGREYSVGFRYPESDNGFAHFVVQDSELFNSKNPGFYHVIVPKNKVMRLNYMKDGSEIGVVTPPEDIKAAFEAARVSGKNLRRRDAGDQTVQQRELPQVNDRQTRRERNAELEPSLDEFDPF